MGITGYQLRFWISGPMLHIAAQEAVSHTALVEIAFVITNTERVLLNGSTVTPGINGLIQKTLLVHPGKNIVSIDLYDRYGTHKREYLYILYPQA